MTVIRMFSWGGGIVLSVQKFGSSIFKIEKESQNSGSLKFHGGECFFVLFPREN